MKHKIKIFSLLLVGVALLLGSCKPGISIDPPQVGPTGDDPNQDPTTEIEPGPEEDPNDDGGDDNPSGGDPEPDPEPDPDPDLTGTYTIDLYANGDQHGVIESGSGYRSYPTYITYVKDQMNKCDNPVLISNGDLWQGTYESNIYYGEVLTELLDVAGYSCMTIGNHEFDWGQDVIRENAKLTDVPFLGCNIQYYDSSKQKATGELVDYVEPYTVVTTDCGIKVGIMGAINPDQWSSITSSYVQDIDFVDPLEPMMKYSNILRTEEGCQVVVASFHAGTDDATPYITSLSETSSATGLPYIDAAFTSHDHTPKYGTISGVPYANSGTKNAYLSHIQLTVSDGVVTGTGKVENLSTGSLNTNTYKEDAEARNLIDSKITSEDKAKGDEVEGKIGSNFGRYCYNDNNYGPRLAARSMYEYCKNEGYGNITCAFVNDTRAVLYSGNVTYANILEAVPFFNKTVIMKVSGSVLSRELNYAYGKSSSASVMYYAPNSATINSSTTYTIAAYDYLAYHMNATTRKYNYFSSFTVVAELDMWPADYIANYMNTFSGTITTSNFPDSDFTCLS